MVAIRIIRLKSSWKLRWSVVWIHRLLVPEDGGSSETLATNCHSEPCYILISRLCCVCCLWLWWSVLGRKGGIFLKEETWKRNMLTCCMFRHVVLAVCCCRLFRMMCKICICAYSYVNSYNFTDFFMYRWQCILV